MAPIIEIPLLDDDYNERDAYPWDDFDEEDDEDEEAGEDWYDDDEEDEDDE